MNLLVATLLDSLLFSTTITSELTLITASVLITALTTTTSQIFTLVNQMTSTKNSTYNKIINRLHEEELCTFISIIDELVKEQSDKTILKNSVKKAILSVNEILLLIKEELLLIQKKVNKHNEKYFSYWRYFNCDYNIDRIFSHHKKLTKRYNMLIDLLKIYR